MPDRVCSVDGCTRPLRARGWCTTHYERWRYYKPEELAQRHGMTHHPLYRSWQGMVARCTHPQHKSYVDYGGRGITVYGPWLTDPAEFISWIEANLGERPVGFTMDRIDNDGNYEPGNLRWATRAEQNRNKRYATGVSKTRGVYPKAPGRWGVRINQVYLGSFATEEEATATAVAYNERNTTP